MSTTARREVWSSRSTEMTRRASSIHTGDEPSTSLRGGPPATGTSQMKPSSPYATVEPSGESSGVMSSQNGAGSRPVVSRRGVGSSSVIVQTSEVSGRSWMKTSVRPSAPIVRLRGRSVTATVSSRQ